VTQLLFGALSREWDEQWLGLSDLYPGSVVSVEVEDEVK